ncbi:MAG: TIGR03619 family F420-dependent LLM class oxidoreductase [Acidimicrobiales bacterium]
MLYGIHGGNTGRLASPEGAEAICIAAQTHRLESVWAWEQIAIPAHFESPWPYSPDGALATPDDVALMDPLIWLSWVGRQVPDLMLATGVLLLALHEPITLAKTVATLDLLTQERVTLGIGVGWLEEEYQVLGKDFTDRGRRTDDAIAALRRLWSDSPSTFSSETISFPALFCEPRPKQTIPIVIAGGSRAAARRAGRLGDGFYPHPSVGDDIEQLLEVMRSSARDAGRDPDEISLTVGGDPTNDAARRAQSIGAQRFLIDVYGQEPDDVGRFIEQCLNDLG